MFLSLLYCLSSDTSSEIGEISLNLPWASGYDWQDLIKLYLHLLCLQSEYCPGRGLRDHCPVIVLTPFNLQARNRRLGEMQGRGWRGTSVLCMRVSSVSAALPSPGVRPSGLVWAARVVEPSSLLLRTLVSRLYVKNPPRAGESKSQNYGNIFSHYKMFIFTVR